MRSVWTSSGPIRAFIITKVSVCQNTLTFQGPYFLLIGMSFFFGKDIMNNEQLDVKFQPQQSIL